MATTRRRLIALTLALPLAAATAGCTRMYRNHGYVPTDDELAMVVVGQTSQAELEGLIGRPGAQGLLTGSDWYYVGSRWERYGLNFDQAGTVTNVQRFGLEQGRIVVLSQRVTDTGVSSASVLRQLFARIGRFNPGQMFGN